VTAVRPRSRAVLAALALALLALLGGAPAHAATTTVTGTVQVVHSVDRTLQSPVWRYLLQTPRATLTLRGGAGRELDLRTGDRIRVAGSRHGDVLTARRITRLPAARRLLGGTPVVGTRKVAVILVNFADNPVQPWTKAQIEQAYFTGPGSVAAYYEEQSFGQLHLTGDVFDWVTISASKSPCNWSTWSGLARQASGAGIAYNHFVYVFPYTNACGWAGLAYMPGMESWINGYPDLRVMGHELGHNLGVDHASTLTCRQGGAVVTLSATCDPLVEYGDPFTIMGQGSTVHFNGYHKGQLGWLAPGNERTATTSGTYTVAPLSSPSAGVQSLRIRRSTGEWIYCDLRAPVGGQFEQFSPSDPATQGVLLRLAPDYTTIERSKLLDATPGTATFGDAALLPGQTFTDPVSGISITAGAVTAAGATLEVTLPGGGGPDTTPPGTPTGLTATLAGGGVQLAWNAAPGSDGVVAYRVLRDGVQLASVTTPGHVDAPAPTGRRVAYAVLALDGAGNASPVSTPVTIDVPAAAPPAPFTVTAAPLGATSVSLSWAAVAGASAYRVLRDGAHVNTVTATSAVDPARTPGTRYVYGVVALDPSGNPIATSGSAEITLPVVDPPQKPRDATPPRAPAGLTARLAGKGRLRLSWRPARDNVGVAFYRVERGGRLVLRTRGTSALLSLRALSAPATLTVRGVDAAGNVGPAARVVYRRA
jgi:hypothetical protein